MCQPAGEAIEKRIRKDDYAARAATFGPSGNTKGGSITVPLTSCLTGLESAVLFLFAKQTNPDKSNRRSTVQ
jgi:hypothetical protein